MPIIFKLVNNEKNYIEIRDSFVGTLELNMIISLFNGWSLSHDEISKIKVIVDTLNLDHTKKIPISHADEKTVYLFTVDPSVRTKLYYSFMQALGGPEKDSISSVSKPEPVHTECNSGVESSTDITKPITQNDKKLFHKNELKLTPDIIDTMNVKSVSLFIDPDFRNLISIYLRRPELFTTLALYTQNGNIVNEEIVTKTIDNLTDDELVYYRSLADKINHLELGVTNDVIISKLIRFNGHLNLTVRSILMDLVS